MIINFYQLTCEKNRVDKTDFLVSEWQIEGTIKNITSIINPIITIQVIPDTDFNFIYNYCYIGQFNRYYFITDVVLLNNALIQISLKCDVLYSFKDNILAQNAFVLRNEYSYDNNLVDQGIYYEYNKDIEEYEVENITYPYEGVTSTYNNYVLDSSGARVYVSDPEYKIKALRIMTEKYLYVTMEFNPLSDLNKMVTFLDLSGNIISSEWFPFNSGLHTVKIKIPYGTYTVYLSYYGDEPDFEYNRITNFNPAGFNDQSKNIIYVAINTFYNDISNKTLYQEDPLPSVNCYTAGQMAYAQPWVTNTLGLKAIAQKCVNDNTVISWIVSMTAYPFEIDTYLTDQGKEQPYGIYLGDKLLGSGTCYLPLNKVSPSLIIAEFEITGTDTFLDFDPYTKYELYLPYSGWITLDASQVLNKILQVRYIPDFTNGQAFIFVVDTIDKKIIYGGKAQLGVMIPLSTSNALEIASAQASNGIALGTSQLLSGLQVLGGFALSAVTENPFFALASIGAGVTSAATGIVDYATKEMNLFLKGECTATTGVQGLYGPQHVRLRKTKAIPKFDIEDNDYKKLAGKPLCAFETLNNLNGYTVVGDIHLENFNSATSDELTSIEELLKAGIIL